MSNAVEVAIHFRPLPDSPCLISAAVQEPEIHTVGNQSFGANPHSWELFLHS